MTLFFRLLDLILLNLTELLVLVKWYAWYTPVLEGYEIIRVLFQADSQRG